jgi:hypothetical protein
LAHLPTDRRALSPTRLLALFAALALLSAGCGVTEYANQMSSEAGRVRAWKQENDRLGKPLWMPEFPKKDGKEVIWDVFLRPPLGVSEVPITPPKSNYAQMFGPLVQYPAGNNIPSGIRALYLGYAADSKDFMAKVYNQFGVAAGGETTIVLARSTVLLTGTAKSLSPEVTIKRKLAEGQSLYSFNFCEHGSEIAAVVFQMDKGSSTTKADDAISASLATLGVGYDEERALREAYNKSNRKVKKP